MYFPMNGNMFFDLSFGTLFFGGGTIFKWVEDEFLQSEFVLGTCRHHKYRPLSKVVLVKRCLNCTGRLLQNTDQDENFFCDYLTRKRFLPLLHSEEMLRWQLLLSPVDISLFFFFFLQFALVLRGHCRLWGFQLNVRIFIRLQLWENSGLCLLRHDQFQTPSSPAKPVPRVNMT